MGELVRLDSTAPVVAARFRQASPLKRREAVRLACEHAATAVGLAAPEVREALDVLQGINAPDSSLCGRLESLAARLDDEYFQLEEDYGVDRNQEALDRFSKARAASALAFALGAESELHEAIYEALSALNDPGEILRVVEDALG